MGKKPLWGIAVFFLLGANIMLQVLLVCLLDWGELDGGQAAISFQSSSPVMSFSSWKWILRATHPVNIYQAQIAYQILHYALGKQYGAKGDTSFPLQSLCSTAP